MHILVGVLIKKLITSQNIFQKMVIAQLLAQDIFGLQHITYDEKITLGFNKIFPERSADEVLKNIQRILIIIKILKNLFMLKLISLNLIVLLIMEVLSQINLKVCIFQNIYQKIFIAEKNLQKCKEQLKKWMNSVFKIINLLKKKIFMKILL